MLVNTALATQTPGIVKEYRVKNTFARGEIGAFFGSADTSQIWVFLGTAGDTANGTGLANTAAYKVAGVANTAIAINALGPFTKEGAADVNLRPASANPGHSLRLSQTVAGEAEIIVPADTLSQGFAFGWAFATVAQSGTITAWIRTGR